MYRSKYERFTDYILIIPGRGAGQLHAAVRRGVRAGAVRGDVRRRDRRAGGRGHRQHGVGHRAGRHRGERPHEHADVRADERGHAGAGLLRRLPLGPARDPRPPQPQLRQPRPGLPARARYPGHGVRPRILHSTQCTVDNLINILYLWSDKHIE